MTTQPRISLGTASCKSNLVARWPLLNEVCTQLSARLEKLRARSPTQVSALPEEESEQLLIRGKAVTFTTYRKSVGIEGTLIVVQAFFPTFLRANIISLAFFGGRSGRVAAEGLLLTPDGRFTEAPEGHLWQFR